MSVAITRIFFIGDVVGRPGRRLVEEFLPKFRQEREIDFVIANGENAAGGKGLTRSVSGALFRAGVDVITGGNHIWKNREIYSIIDEEPRILRPANYPADCGIPGRGSGLFEVEGSDVAIGVVNLMGRIFMAPIDCPFRVGKAEVDQLRQDTALIIVDIHAEATSEKISLGWYLDGQVTAVLGTHTHVPTADEMITQQGTAFQSDVGMTGPFDGVLGVRKDIIIQQIMTQTPVRHELASEDLRLCGTIVEADSYTGRALSIERVVLRPNQKTESK